MFGSIVFLSHVQDVRVLSCHVDNISCVVSLSPFFQYFSRIIEILICNLNGQGRCYLTRTLMLRTLIDVNVRHVDDVFFDFFEVLGKS